MKITMFIAGLFFLFNPNIATFDPLPDLIGYLLLFRSLTEIALVQPNLEDARDAFRKLAICGLGRIAAYFLLLSLRPSSGFDRGWDLTIVFVFAILELLFSFKAFHSLFEGLDTATMRWGNSDADEVGSNARSMTWIFLVAKPVLCVAAELPFLMETSTSGSVYSVDLLTPQALRSVLNLLNLCGGVLIGLIWFFLMRAYLRRFRSADFLSRVHGAFLERLSEKPGLLLERRLAFAYRLIGVGAVALICFTVWNVNIIPEFLFPLLCLCALLVLNRKMPDLGGERTLPCPRSVFVKGLLYLTASLGQFAVSVTFFTLYHTADDEQAYTDIIEVVISQSTRAHMLLILLLVFTVLQGLCAVVFAHALYKILRMAARKYTGIRYENAQLRDRNDVVFSAIDRALRWAFVCMVLLAVSTILQQALLFVFPLAWFCSFAISVALLVTTMRAVSILSQETKNHFLYQ